MAATQTNDVRLPATALAEPSVREWGLRLLAYPLFFASGAAGLIYEVVWTRTLLAVFGAGLYAVCAVLAAFMAGLALGSWILGRTSDRLARPLRLYSALEILIGLCGLILLLLLRRVDLVDHWAYLHWGQNFAMLTGFRFALAFAAMLVPTTLMGATLPVLSRFLVRDQAHLGLHVGWLYSINTFGAVSGAFLAGFFLIARFGLLSTEWIAAGLNFLVGALALVISISIERRSDAADSAPDAVQGSATVYRDRKAVANARWVLFTAFASGCVALAAQVLWSRSLIFNFEYLKNTTYTFSAMLTVFLAGLALGSALIGLIIDSQRNPLRLYGILLSLIGMSILFSVSMLYYGADRLKFADPYDPATGFLNWYLAVANVLMQSIGVLGIPTFLMGMAFPVAARVVVQIGRVGRDVGNLYALNTIGAILGSVLAGFVIIPTLGLTRGLIALGTVNMVLGVLTILRSPEARIHGLLFGVITALMFFSVWHKLPSDRGLQPLTTLRDVQRFYEEGSLATVAVIENNLKERTIYVDGVGVAGTDPVLQTDQKSLAHIPMMLLRNPSSALTVGFGSGGCSYSLLLHDLLKQVHCVEICPTVLNAAPTLTAANHRFFGEDHPLAFSAKDPRYQIILDDARSYLKYTTQKYDFIATDCTDLRYKSNANLYDLEYFQACRERLTPEGIVVVWMPLGGLSPEVFKVALRTFYKVFPAMGVFFMDNEPTHYILLIGWQDKIQMDYSLFERRLQESDVRADLAELYLDDPVKLLSCFITGGERLGQYLGEGPLNTENDPVLEFESPKYGYYDKPLIDNLNALMTIRVSPREFLTPGSIPPKELERLERYEKALPEIIKGHGYCRNMELEQATRCYLKAKEFTPEDLSLTRNLLTFPILQMRIQLNRNDWIAQLLLGRVYMIEGQLDQAYDLLVQARQLLEVAQKMHPEAENEKYLRQARQWADEVRRSLEGPIRPTVEAPSASSTSAPPGTPALPVAPAPAPEPVRTPGAVAQPQAGP